MRCLLICLGALSMAGCATTGDGNATGETAKVSCCAKAKAEDKPCPGCATKKAKKGCCAKAKAEGKPCAECATKKPSPDQG